MPRPVALLLVLPGLKHHVARLQDTEWQCHTLFNISLTLTAAGLVRPETSCGSPTEHGERQCHTLFNISLALKHHVALLQDTVNGNVTPSSSSTSL